jgi:hypothetical protein
MSSDRKSSKNSIVTPFAVEPRLPEDVVSRQDLYRTSPTADRAYNKFLARGSADGHDLEDWLSSEREIEAEQRTSGSAST